MKGKSAPRLLEGSRIPEKPTGGKNRDHGMARSGGLFKSLISQIWPRSARACVAKSNMMRIGFGHI